MWLSWSTSRMKEIREFVELSAWLETATSTYTLGNDSVYGKGEMFNASQQFTVVIQFLMNDGT